MRVAVVPGPGTSGVIGVAGEPPERVADLAKAISARERSSPKIRWVWTSAADLYPGLLAAGVRVARCHDIALTERLLRAREGAETAEVVKIADAMAPPGPQPALFGPDHRSPRLADLLAAHDAQRARLTRCPAKFRLLAAVESAGGLAAAEMSAAGLPWRADVHARLLSELLGPRSARPKRLDELAARVTAALGATRPVNLDSAPQLRGALRAAGIEVESTRAAELRQIDHPAIAPLLEYKELARLLAAFGWSWLDRWVPEGRFHPEFVVAGVVSGRWASRGGGALQIPKRLRPAVVADPGWVLVVADAAQLEPRVLAALSGDRALVRAAAGGDVYQALAASFGNDRHRAKVALISAMYGGGGGAAVFRQRFPAAARLVEDAARAGEQGRVVDSVLGRRCPPPSTRWREASRDSPAAARARGRFTRNFVVQASAADWALVLLAGLRSGLRGGAELVFFQHDEVIVHCPEELADPVVAAVGAAAAQAGRMVFGQTPVMFPMTTSVVRCYAEAK